MNDGTVLRYDFRDRGVTAIADAPEELDVGMNQFAATRNSATTLVATGGPCPIVGFRHQGHRAGALVHISGENAEQDGDDHEIFVARLLAAAPELHADAQICICFDPAPAPGIELPDDLDEQDLEAQTQLRLAYVENVAQYLEGLGFHDVARLTEGAGKKIYLNTADGLVMFMDGEDNFLKLPDNSWAPPAVEGEAGDADAP